MTSGDDKTIRLWDLEKHTLVKKVTTDAMSRCAWAVFVVVDLSNGTYIQFLYICKQRFSFQVIANCVHYLACMVVVCRAVAFSPDGSLLGVGFGGRIGGAVLKQKDGAHAILRADTLETVHQVRCRACYW